MSNFVEKFNALSAAIKMLFAEMKKVKSKCGDLYYEDDELKVGTPVFSDEGPAPDGEYIIDDKAYVVSDGKVSEVKDVEPEPKDEPMDEPKEDPADKPMDEPMDKPMDEPKEEPKEEPVAEPEKPAFDPQPIYDEIGKIADRITAIEAALKDLSNAPEGTVPQEGFSKVSSLDEYGTGIEAIKKMKSTMRIK